MGLVLVEFRTPPGHLAATTESQHNQTVTGDIGLAYHSWFLLLDRGQRIRQFRPTRLFPGDHRQFLGTAGFLSNRLALSIEHDPVALFTPNREGDSLIDLNHNRPGTLQLQLGTFDSFNRDGRGRHPLLINISQCRAIRNSGRRQHLFRGFGQGSHHNDVSHRDR